MRDRQDTESDQPLRHPGQKIIRLRQTSPLAQKPIPEGDTLLQRPERYVIRLRPVCIGSRRRMGRTKIEHDAKVGRGGRGDNRCRQVRHEFPRKCRPIGATVIWNWPSPADRDADFLSLPSDQPMPFAHRVVALVIAMTCTGVAKAEPVSLPAAKTPSRAQAAAGDEAHARTTSSFSESNETSSRRQATFNERIARRGERAIASLCNGCGTDASRQKPRATNP